MSDAGSVHKGVIGNNVNYELFALEGFSGMSEIALKIEGQLVYVVTLEPRRTGNVVCKPSHSREILIKRDIRVNLDEISGPEPVDLSDVAGGNMTLPDDPAPTEDL